MDLRELIQRWESDIRKLTIAGDDSTDERERHRLWARADATSDCLYDLRTALRGNGPGGS